MLPSSLGHATDIERLSRDDNKIKIFEEDSKKEEKKVDGIVSGQVNPDVTTPKEEKNFADIRIMPEPVPETKNLEFPPSKPTNSSTEAKNEVSDKKVEDNKAEEKKEENDKKPEEQKTPSTKQPSKARKASSKKTEVAGYVDKSGQGLPVYKDGKRIAYTQSSQVETIESALEAAYLNNTELAAAVRQLNQMDENIVQAKAGYRPNVSLKTEISGSQTTFSGDSKNRGLSTTSKQETLPTASGSLQLDQNLYAGGATTAQLRGAENSVKAERAKLLATQQSIFFQVIQTYLNILTKLSELELHEGNYKLLKKTLDAAKDKFMVGEETRTSVAQAEAQLADAAAQLETTEAELDSLKATFQRLTGRMPRKVIKPSRITTLPKSLQEAKQLVLENNPGIIQAKFSEAAAQYEVERIKGGLLPSLDFQTSTTYTHSNSETRIRGNDIGNLRDKQTNLAAKITLSVPIYERGNIRSQKRKAHEAAAERRIAIETARRQEIEQLIQRWENFVAATANLVNFKKQIDANTVSLNGTQEELKVGTKILLDVLNAQRALLSSQLNLVRAENTYFTESFRILASTGRLTAKQMKLKVNYYEPSVHYNEVKDKI